MKKFLSLAAVMLAAAMLLVLPAAAVVDPSEEFYVADYANVLSPELEELLINYNGALEQQCKGAQFVVCTVNYLDGMYSDEYAAEIFNKWGIGSSEENNGVLLLLGIKEGKGWMMQGYGIKNVFTDSDIDSILNNSFWNDFDSGRYDEAVEYAMYEVLEWFDGYYDSSVVASNPDYKGNSASDWTEDEYYVHYGPAPEQHGGISFGALFIVIVLIILVLMPRGRGGSYRRYGSGSIWPWIFLSRSMCGMHRPPNHFHRPPGNRNDDDHRGPFGGGGGFGGFGGGGFGGGGFGGGSGFGGGGFGGGGGGGRR